TTLDQRRARDLDDRADPPPHEIQGRISAAPVQVGPPDPFPAVLAGHQVHLDRSGLVRCLPMLDPLPQGGVVDMPTCHHIPSTNATRSRILARDRRGFPLDSGIANSRAVSLVVSPSSTTARTTARICGDSPASA